MDLNPGTPECQEGHRGKETTQLALRPLKPPVPALRKAGDGLAPDPWFQQGSRSRDL